MLISFEGIDGSGKTTQAKALQLALNSIGHYAILLREPGSTKCGEHIRDYLIANEVDAITKALLYNAARAELVRTMIIPHLELGHIVICDRFADSTIAYQGYGAGVSLLRLKQIEQMVLNQIVPHKTFYLAVSIKTASLRDPSIKGHEEFYHKVDHGYMRIGDQAGDRWVKIDAEAEIKEAHYAILDKLNIGLPSPRIRGASYIVNQDDIRRPSP